MTVTFPKACEIAGYDQKRLIDDRVILRREAGVDFLTTGTPGQITLDADDAAALILYSDLRRLGHPVKLAGTLASRIRSAMRDYPDARQLVSVTLQNGSSFAVPVDNIDLSSGYTSGHFILTATIVEVRNLRVRAQEGLSDAAA